MPSNVGQSLIEIEIQLANELLQLDFSDPVEYVYNPIEYAIETHTDYIEKYANESPKSVMFLGMNPGPWGMAQTGSFIFLKFFLLIVYAEVDCLQF